MEQRRIKGTETQQVIETMRSEVRCRVSGFRFPV